MSTYSKLLWDAAAVIQDEHPIAAAFLRCFDPTSDEAKRMLRRSHMRRLKRRHFPDTSRSAAAKQIATRWREWDPFGPEPLPGSIESSLSELTRLGIDPVSWRTITDDLDEPLQG